MPKTTYTRGLLASSAVGSLGRMLEAEVGMQDAAFMTVEELAAEVVRLREENAELRRAVAIADEFCSNASSAAYREQAR